MILFLFLFFLPCSALADDDLSLIGGSTFVPPYTSSTAVDFSGHPVLPGDVNGDGLVTVADAAIVLRSFNGLYTLTTDEILRADVSIVDGRLVADGFVTSSDVTAILRLSWSRPGQYIWLDQVPTDDESAAIWSFFLGAIVSIAFVTAASVRYQ